MGKIILVTGGARSGKSSFAETLALFSGQKVVYFATAEAFDAEMEERIKLHRIRRPAGWSTVEEPLAVVEKMVQYTGEGQVILLDCLTLWLSNLLLAELNEQGEPQESCEHKIARQVEHLIEVALGGQATLICVSNEVGWSLVPENKLGRLYRDMAGRANQTLARAAAEVYMVVAGYPLEIKAPGSKILAEVVAHK